MIEDVASNIWQQIKPYLHQSDYHDAAMSLIEVLVNNDCSLEQIKESFASDKDVKRAVIEYIGNTDIDEDVDEDIDEDVDDDDAEW